MLLSGPMEKSTDKKLIISAYAPPSKSGSGLMMWHLISRFPKESFAILTAEKTDGNETYRLNVPYYYYGTSLTSLRFNDTKDTLPQRLRRYAKNFPPTNFVGQVFYAIRLIQRVVRIGSAAIEKEKPTMLIGYSDIGPALIGTYILSKKYHLPFSLFFYDLYVGNKLPLIFKILAHIFEPKLIREAKHIFVMCDALKELYQKRYGRTDLTIIYNSTALLEVPSLKPSKERVITYLGSVYWAQIDALKDIISALPLITPRTHLKLFTPHSEQYLNEVGIFESDRVSFHTCTPGEAPNVLNESSLNYIGLSLNTPYPNLINTSSPGRLCEFLRADVPILIHAPKSSFLVEYAQKNNFAFISTSQDTDTLARTIATALSGSLEKIQNAHLTLSKNHDPDKNALLYWNKLNS